MRQLFRSVLVPAAAAAALLLPAACGSSSGHSSAPTEAKTPTSTATAKAAPPIVQHQPPSHVPNDAKARKNLLFGACQKINGGWSMTGTAKNPAQQAVTYQITVNFTTSGATVQDYAQTKVKVPAGKTVKWTASKKFRAVAGTRCVVTGFAPTKS